jgi:sugar/nucleoside kinase (ribokinase family)
MQFDVFGMCNALFDIQAEVSDELLASLNVNKGSMTLVDEEEQRRLVAAVYSHLVHTEPGGSGANTMIGLSQLGAKTTFTSRVGADEHGTMYSSGMDTIGVKANLGVGEGDSGICLVLITPDAQRTMCTFLGLSRDLQPEDVNLDDLRNSRYLYVTAYLWDTENQKEAVSLAMREANAAGVKVALSLSDPFCVGRHKADLQRLIENHVDVIFGNWQEAQELTETTAPHEAIEALSQHCEVAVVTLDEKGSLIRQGGQTYEIPVYPVKAVDTTGAGDMYAAGLLYGLSQGLEPQVTGRIASYCAAQVVAKLGPRLESIDQEAIRVIRGVA